MSDNEKNQTAKSDYGKIESARDDILQSAQTLFVCVTGEDGLPDLGTSPFIRDDKGCFYIYTSTLSAHVRALVKGHETRFLLIADEGASQNIWARLRIKFTASVEIIERGSAQFDASADKMVAAFGATMSLIRQFSDFQMVKITPKAGVIVTGFASAFEVTGPEFTIGTQVTKS